jgi:hypothetical protein
LISKAVPDAARGKPIEVWWRDEARISQQDALTLVAADCDNRVAAARSAIQVGLSIRRRLSRQRRRRDLGCSQRQGHESAPFQQCAQSGNA